MAAEGAANGSHCCCGTSPAAERFAKGTAQSCHRGTNRSGFLRVPGSELPVGNASCSRPPPCGWGQTLFQPGVRSVRRTRKAEASESLVKSSFETAVSGTALSEPLGAVEVETGRARGVGSSALQIPGAAAVVFGGSGKRRGRKKLQQPPGDTSPRRKSRCRELPGEVIFGTRSSREGSGIILLG